MGSCQNGTDLSVIIDGFALCFTFVLALSDSQKSALEGITGSFGLSKGAFSNLEVNQVPEPVAAALLLGLAWI